MGGQWHCVNRGRAVYADPPYKGPGGNDWANEPRQDGDDGSNGLIINTNTDSYTEFIDFASYPYLSMITRRAEMEYVNENRVEAYNRFLWIWQLTNALVNGANSDARITALKYRIENYLDQIKRGLDYYGNARHFVPLVSINQYRLTGSALVSLGKNIEYDYREALSNSIEKEARIEKIRDLIRESERLSFELNETVNLINHELTEIDSAIQVLNNDFSEQQTILINAHSDFIEAVVQKSKCSFIDTITAAATLVTAISGGWQSLVAIGEGLKALPTDIENSQQRNEHYIKHLKAVGKAGSELTIHYQDAKKVLDEYGKDSAKIIVDRQYLIEELEPYLNLPEAQQYKKEIERFMELSEERNNKVLYFDSLLSQRFGIEKQLEQLAFSVRDAETRLARNYDPTEAELIEFLERIYFETRLLIIRHLYSQHRALEYWSARTLPFNYDISTVSALGHSLAMSLSQYEIELEKRNGAPQPLENAIIVINEYEVPENIWNRFLLDGILTFRILHNKQPFRDQAFTTASAVSIMLDGLADNSDVEVDLVHSGHVYVVRQDRIVKDYTHRMRKIRLTFSANQTGTFSHPVELGGKEGTYEDVSPFSEWVLVVRDATSINLKSINSISLKIDGSYYAL